MSNFYDSYNPNKRSMLSNPINYMSAKDAYDRIKKHLDEPLPEYKLTGEIEVFDEFVDCKDIHFHNWICTANIPSPIYPSQSRATIECTSCDDAYLRTVNVRI